MEPYPYLEPYTTFVVATGPEDLRRHVSVLPGLTATQNRYRFLLHLEDKSAWLYVNLYNGSHPQESMVEFNIRYGDRIALHQRIKDMLDTLRRDLVLWSFHARARDIKRQTPVSNNNTTHLNKTNPNVVETEATSPREEGAEATVRRSVCEPTG